MKEEPYIMNTILYCQHEVCFTITKNYIKITKNTYTIKITVHNSAQQSAISPNVIIFYLNAMVFTI